MILITILWFLFGILSVTTLHYTCLRDWYMAFGKSNKGQSHRILLWCLSPVLIIFGLFSFIVILLICYSVEKYFCFYFKLPKKE